MNLVDVGSKVKQFSVRVSTIDADLEFKLEESALGRDLFDLVCRTLGLREVLKHDLKRTDQTLYFQFVVKFYPEIVEDELIQPITRHLFYMQVKQAILRMELYCPPDIAVLLATYMTQAELGDYNDSTVASSAVQLEQLLPPRVLSQYQMTPDMWLDRINTWWHNNKGMSREDAELEYLRVAQELKMFGVHFFLIQNKNKTKLWLGVAPHGINIFEEHNKQVPKTRLKWDEIRNISFRDKKDRVPLHGHKGLPIPRGPPKVIHQALHHRDSAVWACLLLQEHCQGGLNLNVVLDEKKRRQADSIEVQHMKCQAKRDRMGRMADIKRYEQEKALREAAEQERDLLRAQLAQMTEKLSQAENAAERAAEMADLLAEKARISEEEALVLSKRAAEAEAEVHRINISAIKSEEAKMIMERKAREAELLASQIVQERHDSTPSSNQIATTITGENMWRCGGGRSEQSIRSQSPNVFPPAPHHFLHQSSNSPTAIQSSCLPPSSILLATASSRSSLACSGNQLHVTTSGSGTNVAGTQMLDAYNHQNSHHNMNSGAGSQTQLQSIDDLATYNMKDDYMNNVIQYGGLFGASSNLGQSSGHLHQQLAQLRRDIEALKVENRETDDDRIYAENLQRGETKYSTLRKIDDRKSHNPNAAHAEASIQS